MGIKNKEIWANEDVQPVFSKARKNSCFMLCLSAEKKVGIGDISCPTESLRRGLLATHNSVLNFFLLFCDCPGFAY